MSSSRTHRRPRSRRPDAVQKPRGTFHPRVQAVGPERFGLVAVDCAKARSRWLLADFYGNILIPPTTVEHNRAAFAEAMGQLRPAIRDHNLKDLLVAVERTGRYHHAPKRAFAAAGFATRIVHPFATKQLRQPVAPVRQRPPALRLVHAHVARLPPQRFGQLRQRPHLRHVTRLPGRPPALGGRPDGVRVRE